MAPVALNASKQPIAIRPDCITNERTTILVKQKAAWSHGDFIAQKADGTPILTSSGKVLSNSARKEFQDASGLPLFSLRRAWFSLTRHYWLEIPGGQEVLSIRQRWWFGKVKFDCMIRNALSHGQEVVFEVRGADMLNTKTDVLYDGKKLASIQRKMDHHTMSYKFLPEYEVDVAGGADTALVILLPFRVVLALHL